MSEQLLHSLAENCDGLFLLEPLLSCDKLESRQYGNTFLLEKSGYLFLFQPYIPISVSDPSIGFVDSYYPAYQILYHRRNKVLDLVKEEFPSAASYRGWYKNLMVFLKIGHVMRNTLIWIRPFGTFFCVEVIDLYDRLPIPWSPVSLKFRTECENCGICRARCPSGAICDDGFTRSKCLRQWQFDFADFENKDQRQLLGNRILGCNTCQIHCPFNHEIAKQAAEPAAEYKELFQLDILAAKTCLPGFRDSEYADVFGRNYAKPMKILSFALNAMLNDEPDQHAEIVQQCLRTGNPNAKPMLRKYLEICRRE